MLTSLNSGVSGLRQFQGQMDVIGNNIANANTLAYKSARVDFADAFSQTLEAPSSTGSTPAMQVGTGVSTAAVRNVFRQGALSSTGLQTDLAISGEGFFVVWDPTAGTQYATRAGNFRVDENGYLVTSKGYRVQGFSDGALTTRGDVRIDGTGRPATSSPTATVVGHKITSTGQILVQLSDNTEFARGQVLLQKFQNAQALAKEGDNLYSGLVAAGPLGGATPQAQAPGSNGLGQIQSGHLELSNVDLAGEFAGLITSQRGFQASARIITTSDEVLQELVNMVR